MCSGAVATQGCLTSATSESHSAKRTALQATGHGPRRLRPPIVRTPEALQVWGPRTFGFDVDYVPMAGA